jgi:hypothetical protein
MNVTKQDIEIMSYNSQSFQQCVCGSIEDHIAETVDMYHKRCNMWCEVCKNELVGNRQEDLVPKQATCKNCGKKKGFKFTDDSGVEDAERNEHEMYAKGKASLLQEDEEVEVLDEYESEIAEKTQIPENNPEVKSTLVKQVFTIEPKDGFDSSGFIEYDNSHKGNIHETCYGHLVNAGNTPHMQKKIPISELIAIKDSTAKMLINLWQPKTYGSRKTYNDCEAEIGFTPEAGNRGNRKLTDQKINSLLDNITFASKDKMKLETELEEHLLYLKETKRTLGKYAKSLMEKMEKLDEKIAKNKGVIYTGNASCGYQSPMYETKINDYDPVSFEKLALELDIPWNENVLDTHKLAKRVEQEIEDVWRYNYVM